MKQVFSRFLSPRNAKLLPEGNVIAGGGIRSVKGVLLCKKLLPLQRDP